MTRDKFPEICIVIPAYNRPEFLNELLESIAAQDVMPESVLVIEDCSPQRSQISALCAFWKEQFSSFGVNLIYVENQVNLGYDANVRRCLELCEQRWAMLMGNDDLLLRNAISEVQRYVCNGSVMMVSRSFLRFEDDISLPIGLSSLAKENKVFHVEADDPKFLFRSSAFVGGLVFDAIECKKIATSKYDGSLYYQVYLAAVAFCTTGIGYIAKPIVGGRTGNPPMFGSANSEVGSHIPGSYTANSRGVMWAGVLMICADIGNQYKVDLTTSVRRELTVRQSFHIFEMNASASKEELLRLRDMLRRNKLYGHWLPKLFFSINYLFGNKSKLLYRSARSLLQHS
ncbi:MAG: glycosyltransferase family 2 protein [Nevskiaceae bacterium]|nr:MAG: glycosyltransferase family 2 protein [Nevskiaceae bacterium]